MYTIGQIGKSFHLARSTLLYYDSIGLLKPSRRSAANYRRYSEEDLKRLHLIRQYRDAGLPLEKIKEILDSSGSRVAEILEKRLEELNILISELRNQQHVIVKILQNKRHLAKAKVMTKESWTALLRAAGLDEKGMCKWHIEFEKLSPEGHHSFLESLGIADEEIRIIREYSQRDQKQAEKEKRKSRMPSPDS
jgi:DNA-binding transcriptional MerR regulator